MDEDEATLDVEALEYELNQVGLSVEDLQPPEGGHYDRRAMARVESAQLMSRKFIERDAVKASLLQEQASVRRSTRASRDRKTREWEVKTAKSPFRVDLLAENERVDEENKVRLREEARRAKAAERRRIQAKNDIILEALTEASDLEALRREKRAIIEEERRLKALLDLEKTNGHRKAQMLAAQRAEKQRHATKAAYRRRQFTSALEEHQFREAEALKALHAVPEKPNHTFSSFDAPL
jgi:hypothetical protein